MYMSKKSVLKRKSKKYNESKKSKKSKKNKKNRNQNLIRRRTQKIRGGLQNVYISVQPTALGVRGAREWSNNEIVNADKPYVPKLTSKVLIDYDGMDVDERIAEIVGSIKDSDNLMRPLHRKMISAEILSKTTK
jgi:hypothetical protein